MNKYTLILPGIIGRVVTIILLLYFIIYFPSTGVFSLIAIGLVLVTVRYCKIFKDYLIIGIFPFYKKKIYFEDITKYKVNVGVSPGGSNQFVIFTKNNKKHSFNYSKNMHYQYVTSLMKQKGVREIE